VQKTHIMWLCKQQFTLLVTCFITLVTFSSNLESSDMMAPTITPVHKGGNRIAFVRDFADIYLVNIDSSNPIRIATARPGPAGHPSWAPGGHKLVFDAVVPISKNESTAYQQIFTVADDGSNLAQLTHGRFDNAKPEWSPDGRLIAFLSDRDGHIEIYLMDTDGFKQRRLTNNGAGNNPLGDDTFSSVALTWSPDGEKIAFVSSVEAHLHRDGYIIRDQIYILNVTDSQSVKAAFNLTQDVGDCPGDYANPAWSPDGRQIAFTICTLVKEKTAVYSMDIYRASSREPQPVKLVQDMTRRWERLSWSPDGKKLIAGTFLIDAEKHEIVIIDIEKTLTSGTTKMVQFFTDTDMRDYADPAWEPGKRP
jgi:Tol biopolymer transport system component